MSNKHSFNVKIGVPPRARWQLVLNMYARPKSPRTATNERIPMKMKNPGVDVMLTEPSVCVEGPPSGLVSFEQIDLLQTYLNCFFVLSHSLALHHDLFPISLEKKAHPPSYTAPQDVWFHWLQSLHAHLPLFESLVFFAPIQKLSPLFRVLARKSSVC